MDQIFDHWLKQRQKQLRFEILSIFTWIILLDILRPYESVHWAETPLTELAPEFGGLKMQFIGVSHFTRQSQAPGGARWRRWLRPCYASQACIYCISSGLSDADISMCSCSIYSALACLSDSDISACGLQLYCIFRLDTMKVGFTGHGTKQERIETEMLPFQKSPCVQVRCESAPSDTQRDPCDNECDSLWSPLSIAGTWDPTLADHCPLSWAALSTEQFLIPGRRTPHIRHNAHTFLFSYQ